MASENASGSFWMPPQASTIAGDVDALFDFIYYLNVFFFVAITAAVIYFAVRYRRRSDEQLATSQVGHNTLIESAWTFIPLILVIVMFVWGFRVFLDQSVAPDDAYEVKVTASAYKWDFTYDTGAVSGGDLIVPAGRPIKLVMTSTDLLHSFFVPDFRIKSDVVPGRYTTVWFNAPQPGEHQVFCTEYCGVGHSGMLAKVTVLPPAEFEEKLQKDFIDGDIPPAEMGKKLYTQSGCMACHSIDGTRLVGPTWKGLFGSERKLADGSTVKADENYLRESILQPMVKVVESYPPSMPSYQGQLKDIQIDGLIEYIKTLK